MFCPRSDATLDQLDAVESMMDEEAFYRARHVITENQRTMQSEAQQSTMQRHRGPLWAEERRGRMRGHSRAGAHPGSAASSLLSF